MSIITNPIESIKNQGIKIWETKEFAERLALSRTTWFLHMMYCFMFVMVLFTFLIIITNDIFTLHKFYSGGSNWVVNTFESIYYSIHPIITVTIIFFWVSPKLVRASLLVTKAYTNKEKAFFDWVQVKIKMRFPSFKTSAQRDRERLDNPKKKGKLNIKFQKFLQTRNDVERLLIRGTIWGSYIVFLGIMVLFMLGAFSDFFNLLMDIEPEIEIIEEELLVEQEAPTRPDGMPPSTIFDVFISKPDTVIP